MTQAAQLPSGSKSDGTIADVLIVGGGLVGGTLAVLLAEAGLSVTLVDRADPQAGLDAGFDGRASAIALATHRVLVAAGLWDYLGPRSSPIRDIRVADAGSLLFLHYDHRLVGDAPFGYMIENRHLRRALYEAQTAAANLTVVAPADPTAMDLGHGAATLTLADGRVLSARLVVGADGRGSRTRGWAGIRTTGWDYGQTGIVCTVDHEQPHGFVAHEHFLAAGPFAILPIKGEPGREEHQSSLVWTERDALAPAVMALGDDDFLAELALRFGDFLGSLALVGPRWSYPLSLLVAERATAPRFALAGDALHGMHPIAGQGLNMGLRDVAVLAEVLADAKALGLDLGSAAVLEDYERGRRFDNSLMLGMTDALNRLFSNAVPPLRLARDLGLGTVNALPEVKKYFMRHAMGEVGELPRLMRGETLSPPA
ncbi:MAG: 2-octaprenyl-6-methoxyphenyl hydroxylase [Rhodospirillaceae bacterium]|nr:2-octaprenyl-6-methoxyphenyl hydroxylase [Magnetovibrio sp.]MAY67156.1 2-octaprenyl-6-methoxyphenyl hydroxylase [Rhodospirillaceae bacterium]